jgi:hypothetical protein
MTRAITIDTLPERVWPWISQLGRGAGWYSVDWLDDGTRVSVRLVTSFEVLDEGKSTRLLSRMSGDTAGLGAHVSLLAFHVIDSIMACRQLVRIRNRVEYVERNPGSSKTPENGDRDQYQLYEVLYAGGVRAGVAGKESGATSRQAAIRDGVVREAE